MSVLRSLLNGSAIRFAIVGCVNTLFGLMMIYVAKWIGVGDVCANLFGYCCGIVLSFKLNALWTFRYSGRQLPVFFSFLVVLLVAYLLNLATVLVAIRILGIDSYLSQAMGIIPYTLVSYIGSRFLVFNHVERSQEPMVDEITRQ